MSQDRIVYYVDVTKTPSDVAHAHLKRIKQMLQGRRFKPTDDRFIEIKPDDDIH